MRAGPADIDDAERRLGGYRIKPLDIVLLRTDAAKRRTENMSTAASPRHSSAA